MKNYIAQIDWDVLQQNLKQDPNHPLNQIPLGTFSIGTIITYALPWVFAFAGMALLVYLIFGGLQLMLSQGDPKAAAGAKSHIGNALVGFIIIFLAYWATQLVGLIFGLQGITTIFK